MKGKLFATLLMLVVLLVSLAPVASATSPIGSGDVDRAPRQDNLPDPLTTKQLQLKEQALEAKLNGKAYGKTHEVARGQYVELAREGEGA